MRGVGDRIAVLSKPEKVGSQVTLRSVSLEYLAQVIEGKHIQKQKYKLEDRKIHKPLNSHFQSHYGRA